MPLKINMSTLQIRELFKNYIYSAIAKFGWHTECHFVNYNLDTNIFPFVNKAFPSILLRVVNFFSFFLPSLSRSLLSPLILKNCLLVILQSSCYTFLFNKCWEFSITFDTSLQLKSSSILITCLHHYWFCFEKLHFEHSRIRRLTWTNNIQKYTIT